MYVIIEQPLYINTNAHFNFWVIAVFLENHSIFACNYIIIEILIYAVYSSYELGYGKRCTIKTIFIHLIRNF